MRRTNGLLKKQGSKSKAREKVYDLIIIGAGPAGIAAAIYCARQKLDFVILSKDVGGQTLLSSDVENYLGFHFLSGADLVKKFREHIADYGIEIREGESVIKLARKGNVFWVKSNRGIYKARTILIATGKKPKKLNVPGEDSLYGKGVTFCATCDAPLFKGKDVAVVGGGNSAMDAALFAAKYSPKVYLVTINPALEGEKGLMQKVLSNKKITVLYNAITKAILGKDFVDGIIIEQDGKTKRLSVQGVFVEIGLIPSSDIVKGMVKLNKKGEIIVNKNNMTSVPGIFAAGDVTNVCEKQILVAAGEGAKAALDIIKYLQKKPAQTY
ncbi:MAG: FAD-dependent oxidoreductase [Candidatus Woesearchaeota archaeon]